jgi:hypothetical protein
MDQHMDATSTRGFLITFGLWLFANITASQMATYCTIISAIITIIVNIQKLKSNGKKSN